MPTIPILLGLLSALTWGAADYAGGLAAKRTSALGVVIGSHLISLFAFFILAILFGETIPPLRDWLFGAAAGLAGGIGLMLLYRALAESKMSVAAPVSALVAAAIPVVIASLTQGLPEFLTLLGFALALSAVWLLSSGEATTKFRLNDLGLPVTAGLTFGLFFVLLHQASGTTTLWPIVAARVGSLTGLLGYARLKRQSWIPSRGLWGWLTFIGLIDAAGTACYALSARMGRLDVAAVLGSLYPGATVLLAWVFLKEHISRIQVIGIILALGAIVMLTV
jgi:drug/metabolite transporter (DMT)-like permease